MFRNGSGKGGDNPTQGQSSNIKVNDTTIKKGYRFRPHMSRKNPSDVSLLDVIVVGPGR